MKTFWIMLEWFCLALPLLLFSFLVFFWLDRQIFWLLRYGGWILFACYLAISLYALYRYLPVINDGFLRLFVRPWWFIVLFPTGVCVLTWLCTLIDRTAVNAVAISILSIVLYGFVVLFTDANRHKQKVAK